MGALALVLFVAQPMLTGGGDSIAATPSPTPSPMTTAAAGATVAPVATPVTGGASGFSSGDILGLLLRLIVVVVVIFVSLYLLRLYTMRGRRPSSGGNVVRVLDTIGLGSNRQMFLVDAGDKVLLIGATQTQLNLLSELTSPETLTALRASRQPVMGAASASVADLMRRTSARFAARRKESAAAAGRSPTMVEALQQMLSATSTTRPGGPPASDRTTD